MRNRGSCRRTIFLGTSQPSPQYGVLGQDSLGRTVALDLNETHTISLFGVQGGGKSYTLGSIIEAATLPAPPVNQLPSPLATIVFHYSPTLDYEPEFTSMVAPNADPSQVRDLASRYGGAPDGAGRCRRSWCPPTSWSSGGGASGADRAAAEVRVAVNCGPSTGGS